MHHGYMHHSLQFNAIGFQAMAAAFVLKPHMD